MQNRPSARADEPALPPARPTRTASLARSRATRTVAMVVAISLTAFGLSGCEAKDLSAFRGYGAWVDVFDWSPTGSGLRNPPFNLASVDALADNGVQTMWIQTARSSGRDDVVDRPLLERLIQRARSRGMSVVGWYLPEHLDEAKDLRRLTAIAGLGVDAIGIDIESWKLRDIAERNRRLINLVRRLDAAVNLPVTAITVPPYAYEVLRRDLWPNFPYRAVDAHVDAWTLMTYWTYRTPGSREREPYFYLTENVRRLRLNLGRPDYNNIHLAGGLAEQTTVPDLLAMRRAAVDTKAMGGSLYDWTTSRPDLNSFMRGFRDFRTGQPTK